MPRNTRPSIFSVEFDKGKERLLNVILAQNEWDLVKAQEDSNKLKQRELELLEANRQNYNNNISREELEEVKELIEDLKNNKDLNNNIINCNSLGLNYDNLITFIKLIEEDSKDINSIQLRLDIAKEQKEKLLFSNKNKRTNYNLTELLKVIDELEEQKKLAIINSKHLQEDFNNFRKTHYNVEVEALLNQISLNINKIAIKDIIKEGNIEDYKTYINRKLLEV